MENNSNEASVRQYKKSALPRLRWTPQLHGHFIAAVEQLGGKHKATPKRIVQMMGVRGLRMSHVKSHLQMYRSMKKGTTINLVVPTKDPEEEALDYGGGSPPRRKVGENQQEKRKRKERSPTICTAKIPNVQQGKTMYNSQVVKDKANSDALSRQDESEMDEFLQEAIGDCGKVRSLWSFDDHLISHPNDSGYCFGLLLQSEGSHHVNLDLSISSYY